MRKYVSLLALAWVTLLGCRDWDRFDPAAAGGVGAGGVGGTGAGAGGGTGTVGVGGGTGGSVPVAPCNAIDALTNDFDAALGWQWDGYVSPDAGVSVADGNLLFYFGSDQEYAEMQSLAYDIRERTFEMELSEAIPIGLGFWMTLAGDSDNYVEFYADPSGTLNFGYEQGGTWTVESSVAFDLSLHRHWRYRSQGSDIMFDVSSDGLTWTEAWSHNIGELFDPQYARIFLGAGSDVIRSPVQVSVASIRGQTSSAPVCATETLSDDFGDDFRGWAWRDGWVDSGCYGGESSGLLHFSCDPGGDASSAWQSSSVYDLSQSHAAVEIDDFPAPGAAGWMFFALARPAANSLIEMEIKDGTLSFYTVADGNWANHGQVTYDPDAHHFLRIRGADGAAFFEASPDAASWSILAEIEAPFELSPLAVILGAGSANPTDSSDVHFDNFNLGPG